MSLKLVKPGPEHREKAAAFLAEFRAAGDDHIYGSSGLQRFESYAEWLKSLDVTQPGRVRQTTYFSFDGETLIGAVAVRHGLTEQLAQAAGHIGYSVRPSKRRMGYAKMQLRLALGQYRTNRTRADGCISAIVCRLVCQRQTKSPCDRAERIINSVGTPPAKSLT